MDSVEDKAGKAYEASLVLAKTPSRLRDDALSAIAGKIRDNKQEILKANEEDVCASEGRLSRALLARLKLDSSKIDSIISSIESVRQLPDPLGRTLSATELDEDLLLYKVTVPIGVIGAVFESRPNVVCEIGSLCLKSGNSVLLKGGSEAANSNKILYELIRDASSEAGIPGDWIQLLESRQQVREMLCCDQYISLLVPRGSNEFVKYIKENTRIPVLGHASGVCHVYVDGEADLQMAENIVFDAKCQYPAVCNALETLLVDSKIASCFLPKVSARLSSGKVKLKGDNKVVSEVEGVEPATEDDWGMEYNDLILNVKVVDGVEQAVGWINRHGSGHTDSIVTSNESKANYFIDSVDSATVVWNASTRFSDGFRFGLGAEVGISTNKIHARGPVGLEGLVIYKWILKGAGHVVSTYAGGSRGFTHRRLACQCKTKKQILKE